MKMLVEDNQHRGTRAVALSAIAIATDMLNVKSTHLLSLWLQVTSCPVTIFDEPAVAHGTDPGELLDYLVIMTHHDHRFPIISRER